MQPTTGSGLGLAGYYFLFCHTSAFDNLGEIYINQNLCCGSTLLNGIVQAVLEMLIVLPSCECTRSCVRCKQAPSTAANAMRPEATVLIKSAICPPVRC